MSDHDAVEPTPETPNPHPSRRSVLRAGLLALSAAQLPDLFASRAFAQATQPSTNNLVGKLEGAEVVTDPARYPKSFKEAPELAELVKAGKLPPVQDRIGRDPLVVKPLREIGKYGGHLAARVHGSVRHLQRPPGGPERQAPLLGLHGH